MQIVSRQAALDANSKRFFTGQPCANGHVAERYTRSNICVTCTKIRNEKRIAADPQKHRQRAREWQLANPERNKAQKLLWHRERKYGVKAEDVQQLEQSQGGLCLGCEKPLNHAGTCHLDHDHTTGLVRGLLCSRCNLALGYACDDAANLRRLAAYLDNHKKDFTP